MTANSKNASTANMKALQDKFNDMNVPGFMATFSPDEARELFFEENAISDEDAERAVSIASELFG